MSPWLKFPASYFTEPSLMRLRRKLGDTALCLPARLWCFAAVQDGLGSVADYTASELARALDYKGNAKKMLRALKSAGYIAADGTITDWADLFGLCASRKAAGRTRAMKRWGKKADSPSTPPPSEKSQDKKRGEGHAMPTAMPDALPAPPLDWPAELSPDQLNTVVSATGVPADRVEELWPEFRDRKLHYRDPWDSETGIAAFRSFVRDAKTTQAPTCATWTEPGAWRLFLEENLAGEDWATSAAACAWKSLPADWQKKIRSEMGLK